MYKIIANWKMYLNIQQSRNLAARVVKLKEENNCPNCQFIVCASDLALADVAHQLDGTELALGAQTIAVSADPGAFTGQSSGQQLAELGCSYVIIGHSEMRKYCGVDDIIVQQKLSVAIAHQLKPIVCIGETVEERQAGRTNDILARQLQTILQGTNLGSSELIIAYEPRWAISAVSGGVAVKPQEAEQAHQVIKQTLKEFNLKNNISIIYGGSVDATNIIAFLKEPDIDGALIGSASKKEDSLEEIIKVLASQL